LSRLSLRQGPCRADMLGREVVSFQRHRGCASYRRHCSVIPSPLPRRR
jgi:hypothetical protein